jgi:hypothetical protein
MFRPAVHADARRQWHDDAVASGGADVRRGPPLRTQRGPGAPGLATAAILTFIFAWNEFPLAITLTASSGARTVPAAIAFFTGSTQFEQPAGTIAAASVMISIPLVVLVLVFQRRIVAGLTAGAVKGSLTSRVHKRWLVLGISAS